MTRVILGLAAVTLVVGAASAQEARHTPYWASISSGHAMMRAGPGQTYPATWLYVRRDLPIRVIEIYHDWRKIRDPDGATGWMLVRLLSDQRTGIVRGTSPQELHEAPDQGSPVRYHAAPNVVGRLSRCAANWCLFDVQGRSGYIRMDALWGVDQGEAIR